MYNAGEQKRRTMDMNKERTRQSLRAETTRNMETAVGGGRMEEPRRKGAIVDPNIQRYEGNLNRNTRTVKAVPLRNRGERESREGMSRQQSWCNFVYKD